MAAYSRLRLRPSMPTANRSSPMPCFLLPPSRGQSRSSPCGSIVSKLPRLPSPWQMLLAASLLLAVALIVEGAPRPFGPSGAASLAYVGPVATAFAYWAVLEVGRHFRAAVLSMPLLAAPTLGILISALALGESVGASLVAGVLLIAAGIRLVMAEPGK